MTPAQASLFDDVLELLPIGGEHLSNFEHAMVRLIEQRREELGREARMTSLEENTLDAAFVAMCDGIRTGFKRPAVQMVGAACAVAWATPEAAA